MMQEFKTERVNQLEALKVDNECSGLLKDSLGKAFQFFDPRKVGKYSAELNLIVDFIYFRETVNKNNNLPGCHLQNVLLTAKDCTSEGIIPTRRKLLFFLLQVVGSYALKKAQNIVLQKNIENGGDEAEESKFFRFFRRFLDNFEKIFKVANLANFIAFLLFGKYRSISERLCGISMKYINPDTVRYLDFELQNRTIIWGIISDFIQFVLPLANDLSLFKAFSKMFMFTTFLGSISSDPSSSSVEEDKCGICEDTQVTMPRRINNCKHLFCYYCITQHLQAHGGEQNIKCPKCEALFDSLITPTV